MILTSIFSKLPIMKILFTYSSMGARMKSSVTILKLVKVMMNVQSVGEVTVKVKSGYIALYVRAICPKIWGNCLFTESFLNRNLGGKACIMRCLSLCLCGLCCLLT